MKKLFALILVLTLTLTLAACDLPEELNAVMQETHSSAATESTEVTQPENNTVAPEVETEEDEIIEEDTEEEEIVETEEETEEEIEEETKEEIVQTPVVPHTHNYTGTVTTAAGCETDGVKTCTCTCGDSYTQAIAATGHSFDSWYENFPPLFRVVGQARRDCTKCDHFETRVIPALTTSDDKNENFYRHEEIGGSDGSVNVQLRYVYWEDGKLVAHCYIINKTPYTYDTIDPMFMSIHNSETGVLCASGDFPAINLVMPAMQAIAHTFTFSGAAVDNYGADLTTLALTLQF